MSERKYLFAEGAKSTLRTTCARAVAQALITGIDNASEERRPLTELQRTDLATMAMMAYEEAITEGERHIDAEAMLDALISPRRRPERLG